MKFVQPFPNSIMLFIFALFSTSCANKTTTTETCKVGETASCFGDNNCVGMRQCVALDEFGPCECIAEMKDASITDTGAECPFNFAGTNCSTCSDRFRGEGCTDCRTGFQGDFCCPEFFSGVDCSDCASDFAALPDCNTCIKPFLAWPNCTDCIDSKLTGENCDECAEAFKIPPDCIETMPALCPLDPSAECQSASNCGTALPPATNCKACIPYHRSICSFGNCSTPPLLETSDTVRYFFEIGALFNTAVSFAGAVIASESAGGKKWTCDDVYAEQFDWTSSCHNALDTRGQNVIQASSQYSMTFARFASGQTSLFIVYAYSQLDSRGSPIGVSCGEKLVGAPGKGMTIVTGGTMLPLP